MKKNNLLFWVLLGFCILLSNHRTLGSDHKGLNYIYPLPESETGLPQTNIIFKLANKVMLSKETLAKLVTVQGSENGIYKGDIYISDDKKTCIFQPEKQFNPGEKINVTYSFESFSSIHYSYSFTISASGQDQTPITKSAVISSDSNQSGGLLTQTNSATIGDEPVVINGVAVPSDFPLFASRIQGNTAPGYIFIDNWGGNPYNVIFKNDGTPFYYLRTADQSRDFKVQYPGVLSRRVNENIGGYITMDINYNTIGTYNCQNGYGTDEHEFQLLENGHSFMNALDYKTVDMSKLVTGGNKAATVIGNSVQELDKNHKLVFLWTSWDNFNITDAIGIDLTQPNIDYVHMNSIALDADSNLVISSRHLSECTKINRKTGKVMWRLGGKRNQFKFVNDVDQNSYQHDLRPVPGKPNHYTMFDDGNFHTPSYSRAVEFVIDTVAMTATKVWEFRHKPDRYSWWMGNVQRLANGNTFINYGDASLPKATEVTPDGTVVYDGDFTTRANCYRAFRFEWKGILKQPYLIVEPYSHYVRLIFNKFGDTNVKEYKIYAGLNPEPSELKGTTSNTWINLQNLQNLSSYYFRVTAVDSLGNESGYSNTVKAYVKFITPGTNLILNGNFASGATYWNFAASNGATANGLIDNLQQYKFNITSGGSGTPSVELTQQNLCITNGKQFRFEFDAYADLSKIIEPKITRATSPWTNYSQIGPIYITKVKKHYKYDFKMTGYTDNNAQAVFDCGGSNSSVYIDNVSLIEMLADTTKAQAFMTKPSNYSQFSIIDTVKLETTALYFGSKIDSVLFYANNKKISKSVVQPYQASYIPVNDGNCRIFSKAYAPQGKVVNSDTISVSVLGYTVPEKPLQLMPGLNYLYYQGTWDNMPDFNKITPLDSGTVTNVNTTKRKQEQYFAFQFDGYIKIAKRGQYTFYLNSDDGSNLYINNVKIVDNDGLHGTVEVSNKILLREGYYKIGVNFFQKEGGQVCELRYSGPGISKTLVPGTALVHDDRFTPYHAYIESPADNSTYYQGDTIHFETSVNGSAAKIAAVNYFISDISSGQVATLPYNLDWVVNTTTGIKQVYTKVVLANKQSFISPKININILSGANGLSSVENSALFKLFPNPASDQLTFGYLSSTGFTGSVIISDLFGREIIRKEMFIQAGNNNLTLDIRLLKEGMYIASITGESKQKVAFAKFIKNIK